MNTNTNPPMKRHITHTAEQVFRLVHHDFRGLSVSKAALAAGVSKRTIYRLLNEVKAVAPQLFPILTPKQAYLWKLWYKGDMSAEQIAIILGITERAVYARIQIVKQLMGYTHIPHTVRSIETLNRAERDLLVW